MGYYKKMCVNFFDSKIFDVYKHHTVILHMYFDIAYRFKISRPK